MVVGALLLGVRHARAMKRARGARHASRARQLGTASDRVRAPLSPTTFAAAADEDTPRFFFLGGFGDLSTGVFTHFFRPSLSCHGYALKCRTKSSTEAND